MIPVMASTNIDKLKIDFAGVDSGAKILVRRVDEESAAAVAIERTKIRLMAGPSERSCFSGDAFPFLVRFRSAPGQSECRGGNRFEYAAPARKTHHKTEGIFREPFEVFVH